MTKEDVSKLSRNELLSEKTLFNIYEEPDELTSTVLKANIIARAKELKIDSEVKSILKTLEKGIKIIDNNDKLVDAMQNTAVPLKFADNGKPLNVIMNYMLIVQNDDYFKGLKYNLLSRRPEKDVNGQIEQWSDTDDSSARMYIENAYKLHSKEKLDDALRVYFKQNQYHPIKDIINNTKWDGKERISTLLIKWLNCEDTPYTREISRLIFAGGINRLYRPGCKFDDVAVLIGTKQGEGKSTFVRWLALNDAYFTEVTEFEGQRGVEILEGAWICEIAELLALTKAKEVEAVKSYITKQIDRYRAPYDKHVTDHKRQCIFIGTTNKEQFLTDKTGNRRFYPLKVNSNGYDLFEHEEEIREEILQCWAEAKAKFDKGQMPAVADKTLIHQIRLKQEEATEEDYRVGLIREYLEGRNEVCILELWQNALNNGVYGKPRKNESNEIALIMQGFDDWQKLNKSKRTSDYGIQKVWFRIQKQIENNIETDLEPF